MLIYCKYVIKLDSDSRIDIIFFIYKKYPPNKVSHIDVTSEIKVFLNLKILNEDN